jgi:DNA-binding response OmpR family regulator
MTNPSILIIEDDSDIAELLRYNLERERYRVRVAVSGEAGLDLVRSERPDLIILDLGLPGVQGLEVCRYLKLQPEYAKLPVIMLTAKGEESDVVLGLELGADDYLVKPFKVRELVARVRAVLRRSADSPQEPPGRRVEAGPLVVDSERHEAHVDGRRLDLTLAEFRLLRALASNAGRVLTRERLLSHITEGAVFIIDRNVDVHIRALRKKSDRLREMIMTVRGVGYKLEIPR